MTNKKEALTGWRAAPLFVWLGAEVYNPQRFYNVIVPKVGIEPTLPREHEFESCASASSATSASAAEYKTSRNICQWMNPS